MTNFSSFEEFERQNPIAKYSFYANGRIQVLMKLRIEILEEMDAAFAKKSFALHEHISRAEELSWLWLLGSYEVVRTMCQARACFSERAIVELTRLKRKLAQARMPAAKMEAARQAIPIPSSRSASGMTSEGKDLLVGDPSRPMQLRTILDDFYAVITQISSSDVLASHESTYQRSEG